MEMDHNNLNIKVLAVNEDFGLNFGPLGLRNPLYGGVKYGYPLKCAISATIH